MADLEERAALIALLRRDGQRRWPEITDAVEAAGSALAVLRSKQTSGRQALFSAERSEDLTAIQAEIAAWEAEGIQLITVLDENYPQRLLLVHQRPPLLFACGTVADGELAVAVVGTSTATEHGFALATDFAGRLADQGVTIVSGLAAGVDTAAHRAALASGGRTVAVIGSGLHHAHPHQNQGLQHQITKYGLVLSQFWPETPPTQQSFLMRNGVMSGYAQATLVIEAEYQSGARMQARIALEHGRRVFLARSLLAQPWARAYTARPNTTVVEEPDDVLAVLDRMRTIDELVWN